MNDSPKCLATNERYNKPNLIVPHIGSNIIAGIEIEAGCVSGEVVVDVGTTDDRLHDGPIGVWIDGAGHDGVASHLW